MGQKTHPKGLRLEVNKNWTSNWFPKKNAYATDLAQDIKLRKYLKKRLQDASVASVNIERTSQAITVTIHTARPGIVIGRGGSKIKGLCACATLKTDRVGVRLIYSDASQGWVTITSANETADGIQNSQPRRTINRKYNFSL